MHCVNPKPQNPKSNTHRKYSFWINPDSTKKKGKDPYLVPKIISPTCYITLARAHTHQKKKKKGRRKKRKEKESQIMNRKGIVESNEKQDVVMKDNLVKNIHLPYKWFSQSKFSLSKMEVVEAQRKRYKGYQILGIKILIPVRWFILSVLWVEPVRWFINWLCSSVFSPCFLKWGKTEKKKQLKTCF